MPVHTSYLWKFTPILLLLLFGCRKTKPNISISFCNGGMVPDSVVFMESNLSGGEHIWQLFSANGTALSSPVNTGSVNTVVVRFDSVGTYRLKLDVDNEHSTEANFTMRNYIAEGPQRGVSFYDSDLTVWTINPDSDCGAAVRVKQTNGIGGIDFSQSSNKLIYTPFSLITCFPNGEDLADTFSSRFSFSDVFVNQTNDAVFLGAFDDDTGDEVILRTSMTALPGLENNQFIERFVVGMTVKQLAIDPIGNVAYFANDNPVIAIHELVQGASSSEEEFGSQEDKTAVAYDISRRRLVFAEGVDNCKIVIVDPLKPLQRETEITVPCDVRINGIDLDEITRDLVYTDGENIWMINLSSPTTLTPLLLSNSRTMRKDNLTFNVPVSPPIHDVVIARFRD